MITPPTLLNQMEEYRLLMELITNEEKYTQNELRCINNYWMWVRVYSLACITKGDLIHLKTE